jgi:hypothetical protein
VLSPDQKCARPSVTFPVTELPIFQIALQQKDPPCTDDVSHLRGAHLPGDDEDQKIRTHAITHERPLAASTITPSNVSVEQERATVQRCVRAQP